MNEVGGMCGDVTLGGNTKCVKCEENQKEEEACTAGREKSSESKGELTDLLTYTRKAPAATHLRQCVSVCKSGGIYPLSPPQQNAKSANNLFFNSKF